MSRESTVRHAAAAGTERHAARGSGGSGGVSGGTCGALVAAALERRRPRHLQWLLGAGRGAAPATSPDTETGTDPAAPMLAAFDRLESAAAGDSFRGCPFVDAALAAPAAPGHGRSRAAAIAWGHKKVTGARPATTAPAAGALAPAEREVRLAICRLTAGRLTAGRLAG
jgi:hypothetical protein